VDCCDQGGSSLDGLKHEDTSTKYSINNVKLWCLKSNPTQRQCGSVLVLLILYTSK